MSRMRLLVADDYPEWRTIIAKALWAECDLVGIVERGDQILEAAQKFRPEVITLDVGMPGGSGLAILRRLRSVLPRAIIVVVSMTATRLYRQEAFARGADGYVEKIRVATDLSESVASARKRIDPTSSAAL